MSDLLVSAPSLYRGELDEHRMVVWRPVPFTPGGLLSLAPGTYMLLAFGQTITFRVDGDGIAEMDLSLR